MKPLTIYVMVGLPASGKSTSACRLIQDGRTKRINSDLLREMLDNGVYSPENEQFVNQVRDQLIELVLCQGFNVVVDNCNLNPLHRERIAQLAHGFRAKVEYIIMHTPLEECIRRDAAREHPVGEERIRGLWSAYLKDGLQ